jgi:hypothetical protein
MGVLDITFSVVGALFLIAGLVAVIAPATTARWNDTKEPRWVRDYSLHGADPAMPGRTSPLKARIAGVVYLLIAGTLLILGLTGSFTTARRPLSQHLPPGGLRGRTSSR